MVNKASYFEKDDQKVIYVPMVHLNRHENFEEVKNFINEKRKLGYQVYYEQVTYDKDDSNFDIISRKMRKLTGLTFGQQYLSDDQKKYREKVNPDKYAWQNEVDYGVDFENDIHADYTLTALVKTYETKFGEVALEPCDYEIPLNEKYTCTGLRKYHEVVQNLRNEKLSRHLLDTIHKKKLVVYGMGHEYSAIIPILVHKNQYKQVKARNWVD